MLHSDGFLVIRDGNFSSWINRFLVVNEESHGVFSKTTSRSGMVKSGPLDPIWTVQIRREGEMVAHG